MTTQAYELGLDAGRRGVWFHETLDRYRTEGLIDGTDILDFYRGYWGNLFHVQYEDGRIRLLNKDLK